MNSLTIKVEDGRMANINVLDIIDSSVFGKTYIIYTFEDEDFYFDPELTVAQASLLIQNRLRNAKITKPRPGTLTP